MKHRPRFHFGVLMILVSSQVLMLNSCNIGRNDPAIAGATKERPFVNSLGMKFVPVPGTNILMCTTETTVAQYRAVKGRYYGENFPQGENHCAVGIAHVFAKEWCRLLSKKEGRKYRLPTNAEWSAALNSNSYYPWGNQWPPPNNIANLGGQEQKTAEMVKYLKEHALGTPGKFALIGGFRDRHPFTAPVGSYAPNELGIYDLCGNAAEWLHDELEGRKASRGGSWSTSRPDRLPSTYVSNFSNGSGGDMNGFRCVLVR